MNFGSIASLLSVGTLSMEQTEDKIKHIYHWSGSEAVIFCHCPFVKVFQRNRLVFVAEFQELHLVVTFWEF